MILSTEEGDIPDPTGADIEKALRRCLNEEIDYVRLDSDVGSNAFMQAGYGLGALEYCENEKGPIYSAITTPTPEEIVVIFQTYGRNDPVWRTAIEWKIEIAVL